MAMRFPARERGFALLIVLWTLVLLSLVIATMASQGSLRTRQASAERRAAELQALADGGMNEAAFHWLAAGALHWPADRAPHRVKRNGAVLTIRINNDGGKVNPNRASQALWQGLLLAAGADRNQAASLAGAIVAWRFLGAADPNARPAAGTDYLPPNAPFESLDELALVQNMTPALLDRLRPHLSLFRDNDPDPALADPVVRRALALAVGGDPDADAAPVVATGAVDESLVTVDVEAAGPGGFLARCRATLASGGAAGPGAGQNGNPNGNPNESQTPTRPFQVLAWATPAA